MAKVFNSKNEIFMIYVVFFLKLMQNHLLQKSQILLLNLEKIMVFAKYLDVAKFF